MQEPLWNLNDEGGRPLFESLLGDPRIVSISVRDENGIDFLSRAYPERRTGRQVILDRDVTNDDKVIGHVSLEMDTGMLDSQTRIDRRILAWTVTGQLLLSLILIVILLQRRLLAPIKRLMDESERLARRGAAR